MSEPKGLAEILAENLTFVKKPEGFDEYLVALKSNKLVRSEPPAIKQSPENLRPLGMLKGKLADF
jgi:hypothetical protein